MYEVNLIKWSMSVYGLCYNNAVVTIKYQHKVDFFVILNTR